MRPPSTPSIPPVPIQEAVAEFMGALLGLGTAASKITPADIGADGEHVIAVYRDDLGRSAALVTADLALAAGSGAALAMIPAAAAKEVTTQGKMTETLLDNFREVANVTASLLNTPTTPHLNLRGVWESDDPALPAEAWEILANPNKRREFAVTMEGYGSGTMGFVVA